MSDPSLPPNQREFHCIHCNGKIRIPKDLPPTTGPCPICSGIITSPAQEADPIGTSPAFPPVPAPPASSPEPPAPAPTPVSEPIPLETGPPRELVNRPSKPIGSEPILADLTTMTGPATRTTATASDDPPPGPDRNKALGIVLIIVALLGLLGAGFYLFMLKPSASPPAPKPISQTAPKPPLEGGETASRYYARSGWQDEATALLDRFVNASTIDEKLACILEAEDLRPQLEAFYKSRSINDFDTPADAFSTDQLTPADYERGIFMMLYDQPPQFDIKDFFRPLATLEVQYGLNEADLLLSTFARIDNFASTPLRAAAFFKQTPAGLKLDWETFVQTKYRTLETFAQNPEPGRSGVFRVILFQEPDPGKTQEPGSKIYRLSDPVSQDINIRVTLNVDSEIGKNLSALNWTAEQGAPLSRTATVELKWSADDQPKLQMSRFICWEFLHIGGEESAASTPPR